MFEQVNDPVKVLAGFSSDKKGVQVTPYLVDWKDTRYRLDKIGLHHRAVRGDKNVHIFEFAAEAIKFKVELDTETLVWTLVEVFYDR